MAIGRDYFDVPPTQGVYKGVSAVRSELAVAVTVGPPCNPAGEPLPFVPWMTRDADGTSTHAVAAAAMSFSELARSNQQILVVVKFRARSGQPTRAAPAGSFAHQVLVDAARAATGLRRSPRR